MSAETLKTILSQKFGSDDYPELHEAIKNSRRIEELRKKFKERTQQSSYMVVCLDDWAVLEALNCIEHLNLGNIEAALYQAEKALRFLAQWDVARHFLGPYWDRLRDRAANEASLEFHDFFAKLNLDVTK